MTQAPPPGPGQPLNPYGQPEPVRWETQQDAPTATRVQSQGFLPAQTPEEGLPYHRLLRGGFWGRLPWWRSALGVVLLAGLALIFTAIVLAGFVIVDVATGANATDSASRFQNLEDNVTPAVLAFVNLSLIVLIPACWVIMRVVHGLTPRWLSSVAPRLRWKWMAVATGLAFVALFATFVVAALVPDQGGPPISGELNGFTSTTRDFLLVVALLTPLQAAAEEYAFRGYLTQAVGSIMPAKFAVAAAVILPSLLFALAHGAQDAPIFFDRFAFGVVAGILVIYTGGLEAGIAMHVLNNWIAFGLALAVGDVTTTLTPTGGTWWSIPVTLTQSVVFLVLCLWAARRMGLQTHTAAGLLERAPARV